MKYFFLITLFIFSFTVTSQEINTKFINEFELKADAFIGVDNFENIYFIKNNVLFKKSTRQLLSYTNTQLGNINSVDIKNPLKILIFYKDFNTVLLLDNNLNELVKPINLTLENISQNISLAVIGSGNTIWLYSQDDTSIALWNYQTKKIIFKSQPLSLYNKNFKANLLISNYKTAWLCSNNLIIKLNEFGIISTTYKINDIDNISYYNNNIVYLKNNQLLLHKNDDKTYLIKLDKEISIKNFYINKNDIYIFDGTKIYVFGFLKI